MPRDESPHCVGFLFAVRAPPRRNQWVVAPIQGHKPSATTETHDTVRPLALLRLHHEKIEAWILEQAGIAFDAKAAPGALRVVAG